MELWCLNCYLSLARIDLTLKGACWEAASTTDGAIGRCGRDLGSLTGRRLGVKVPTWLFAQSIWGVVRRVACSSLGYRLNGICRASSLGSDLYRMTFQTRSCFACRCYVYRVRVCCSLLGLVLGRSETPFLSGCLVCSMMACRTSVIKQKVFIGRGRKLGVVVSYTIGRSSVSLLLYSSRIHLSLCLELDVSCLPLLPGLRIHLHHENARTHIFERSIRSRWSQVVTGLSRERFTVESRVRS